MHCFMILCTLSLHFFFFLGSRTQKISSFSREGESFLSILKAESTEK